MDEIESAVNNEAYEVSIFIAEHSFTGARTGLVIPHRLGFQRRYVEYMAEQMLRPGEIIVNKHRLSHELSMGIRLAIIVEDDNEGDEECSINQKEELGQHISGIRKRLLETLTRILFRTRPT